MISILAADGVTAVPDNFITAFLPTAPEGYVKVYLYGLMLAKQGASFDIAGALGLKEADVVSAFRYWQGQGLLSIAPGDPPAIRYLCAQDAAPVSVYRKHEKLDARVQELLGSRVLYMPDMQKLYDLVEVYGLEEDAVPVLLAHCLRQSDAEGRKRINFNHLDATGRAWADMGIKTAAQAQAYTDSLAARQGGASAVLRRMGKNRPATEDELALYDAWEKELGYTGPAILCACTGLTAYGTPSFKALDDFLRSCYSAGALNEAGIEELLRRDEQLRAFTQELFSTMMLRRVPALAERQQVGAWRDVWHMDDALLRFAAERSLGESRPFASCKKLVERWHKLGLSRIEDAQADIEAQRTADKPKKGKAFTFLKRTEAPESFAITLDED